MQDSVDVNSFGFWDIWIFGFSDFGNFAVVHRCLTKVMDKWAKCAFPRVVGGVSIYVYIYIYIHMEVLGPNIVPPITVLGALVAM